jgi:DNA-binding GntR family transcriptional regulator
MATQRSTQPPSPDHIAETLERAIITGEFRPRERLTELDLSRRFAANRSRVRSALRVLAERGLVFLTPGRGARVAEYTPKQVEDMFQVRQILEYPAIALALARITAKDVKFLRTLARRFALAAERGVFAELREANDAFHHYLFRASGNETLAHMIEHLWIRCHLVRHFAWLNPDRIRKSAAEHRELVDALAQHDIERFRQIYLQHEMAGRDTYLQSVGHPLGGFSAPSPAATRRRGAHNQAVSFSVPDLLRGNLPT